MAFYDIVLDELVPGQPCEDYVYRYKTVGRLGHSCPTQQDAIQLCKRLLRSDVGVIRDFCVRDDGVVLWNLGAAGWSAWYPRTKRCVRISREPGRRTQKMRSHMFLIWLTRHWVISTGTY